MTIDYELRRKRTGFRTIRQVKRKRMLKCLGVLVAGYIAGYATAKADETIPNSTSCYEHNYSKIYCALPMHTIRQKESPLEKKPYLERKFQYEKGNWRYGWGDTPDGKKGAYLTYRKKR